MPRQARAGAPYRIRTASASAIDFGTTSLKTVETRERCPSTWAGQRSQATEGSVRRGGSGGGVCTAPRSTRAPRCCTNSNSRPRSPLGRGGSPAERTPRRGCRAPRLRGPAVPAVRSTGAGSGGGVVLWTCPRGRPRRGVARRSVRGDRSAGVQCPWRPRAEAATAPGGQGTLRRCGAKESPSL